MEFSPVELAYKLFSEPPKDYNSCEINIDLIDDTATSADAFKILFEILITIYCEGMMHFSKLIQVLNKEDVELNQENYDDIDPNEIDVQKLAILKRWFSSLGYHLFIDEDTEEEYNLIKGNHYCKVILLNNPEDTGFFIYRNIQLPYHMMLNSSNLLDENYDLSDLYAIIKKPKHNNEPAKIFSIRFAKIK